MCSVATVSILFWLLRYAHYGFDFTDESFYLVWIANPFVYVGSTTQFGFVYHPIYKLLGGDIAAFRQANIIVTFGLAWGLVYFYLASLAVGIKESRNTLLVVSAGISTSALIVFDSWLLTPSYNSLNLQALLITATGLVLAAKNNHRASIIGWLLMAVGGWLAFMAKPTTALALAVVVFIYLLLARKFSIRMFLLTVASALGLLLFSALLIDGSVFAFVKRLQLGAEFLGYLGGGHTLIQILRVDDFQLGEKFKNYIFFLSATVSIALWSICAKNKNWSFLSFFISIGFFSYSISLSLGQIYCTLEIGQFQGLLIFSFIYAVIFAALVIARLRVLKVIPVQHLATAAIFLIMPLIYAFGTNNNYWQAAGGAAIFWLIAGLALLGPLILDRATWSIILPLALASQAVTAALLQTGLERPYRQPYPLRFNASPFAIGPQKSMITLSDSYSAYIATAMAFAKEAGFEPEMPMIDLSGQSPGLLYAIGAENVGQAWIIGGYPGSLRLAEAALKYVSCEKISTSWILYEPQGPRSISLDLLKNFGADFPNSYKLVGSWETAEGAGGYVDRRVQKLYKPIINNKNLMNCGHLR